MGAYKRVLCANPPELARCDLLKFLQDGRNEWLQVDHPIGCRAYEQNTQCKRWDVLLEFQMSVHRNECLELPAGTPEQLPILDAGPPLFADGTNVVPA